MSTDIRVCAVFRAAPAAVWRVIERIDRHVEWMADAESIHFTSPQRTGVGTQFECRTRVGPMRLTDVMSITEWVPGQSMGVEHRGIVTGHGRFTLEPGRGATTRFCWAESLSLPWAMGGRLAEQAAAPALTRLWRGNLGRLQRQIEGR